MLEIYIHGIEIEGEPGFTEVTVDVKEETWNSLTNENETKKFIQKMIVEHLGVSESEIQFYNWEVQE